MNKIKILGNEISDLIAAGEVVERPASVVKELVENSIDAGAKKIIIEIRGSGREYIRVADNGCGMSPDDAKTAFMKHATSKIAQKDDLYSIKTLGFRGEALAAISAVSKVTLTTKEAASVSGFCEKLEGGVSVYEGEIGAADGTTVEIRDLFYNTPARLKFVKTEQNERAVITALIEKLTVSHTNIAFMYIINGATRFFTSGNGSLKDAVYSVFGAEIANDLLPVEHSERGVTVFGMTGKPLANKPNRNFQIFYVNGRLIKSKILQQALEMSYKNSMLVGRFPVCVLFITVNTEEIDVNVHPSKLEIKFSDDKAVADAVSGGIRAALAEETGVYQMKFKAETPVPEVKPLTAESFKAIEQPKQVKDVKTVNNWEITSYKSAPPVEKTSSSPQKREQNRGTVGILKSNPVEAMAVIKAYTDKHDIDIQPEKIAEEVALTENKTDYNYIGEVFNAYIIIEQAENIVFIDKHALHERMIFEKLRSADFIEVQTLLAPKLLFLGEAESVILLENKEKLKKIGFELEDFGGSIMIREIPSVVEAADLESLLNGFANELKLKNSVGEELLDTFLYSISCKAAIKSGWRNSEEELKSLVSEYMSKRDNLKYCPHGRPIVFTVSKYAIDKQFKRITG